MFFLKLFNNYITIEYIGSFHSVVSIAICKYVMIENSTIVMFVRREFIDF